MPGRMQGTNTIFFIYKHNIPQHRNKDVTYGCIVCNYCSGKAEPHRTRLTVGGDRINYPDNCGAPRANLLTIKLLLSSFILHQKLSL